MSLFTPQNNCPICNSTEFVVVRREPVNIEGFTDEEEAFFAPYKATGDIEFRECANCSFIYLDRLPTADKYYEVLYGRIRYDYDYEFKYNGKKNIFRDIKRHLKPFKPSGTLLDVGTWCGTLLDALKDTYEVTGCELGVEAAEYGRSVGLNIHTGDFKTLNLGNFDIVTMIDVLEHIPDPLSVLKGLHETLTAGGLLYLKVPNGAAQVRKENLVSKIKPVGAGAAFGFVHINHFSRKSLNYALAQAGFKVLKMGYARLEHHDLSFPHPFPTKARLWLKNVGSDLIVGITGALRIGPHLYVVAHKA